MGAGLTIDLSVQKIFKLGVSILRMDKKTEANEKTAEEKHVCACGGNCGCSDSE
jgi:hypothetical protein